MRARSEVAARETSRQLPVTAGRLRVQARERIRRGCSPAKATRSHQPRFKRVSEGMPAKRLSTRVRLGDAVWQRPGPAPRHPTEKSANSGVPIATLEDMKVLYSDSTSSTRDVGVDDDQRPGADDPRVFHEHGDRPAARQVPQRQRPRPDRRREPQDPRVDARERPRHRAGRHPEGRPGPEHRASSRPSSR
jgi:hypothetical protein